MKISDKQNAQAVVLRNLTKTYGEVVAVDNLNLEVRQGEFLTLLGPSGCGKTTTLMALAGFVTPDRGRLFVHGEDISFKPPHKRGLGMVFQDYALFPHMTVFDNIAFPLEMRKVDNQEIRKKVQSALELVQLAGFEPRFPSQLSGGECQRVALARALVFEPSVLLLDEPLGALDRKLRELMQLELRHIHKKLGVTFISVTHDQDEALTMSDRVLVMDKGAIIQLGTPQELYERPASIFVADFIGKSNLLRGYLESGENKHIIVRLSSGQKVKAPKLERVPDNREVTIQIRPERVFFIDGQNQFDNIVECYIEEIVYLGEIARYIFDIGGQEKMTLSNQNTAGITAHQNGERVKIGWSIDDSLVFIETK